MFSKFVQFLQTENPSNSKNIHIEETVKLGNVVEFSGMEFSESENFFDTSSNKGILKISKFM